MTSTTTRIITITLALIALSAPVAGAMPLRDRDGVQTSGLARTPWPKQDLRNPDQQAPAPRPYQDLRNPDQQAPPVSSPEPVVRTQPVPVATDGGPSPLVWVLPSLALVAMLGAAVIYTRSSRRLARV
jgi:hypothetical protein